MPKKTSPSGHKRTLLKNLLIYPSFQLTLVTTQALIMLGTFSFIGIQIEQVFTRMAKMGQEANLPANHAYYQFLKMQSDTLFFPYLIIAFLVAFIVSSFVTFYISHKLAGPIVRMTSYFKKINRHPAAKIQRLVFRQGDFFQELPPQVNSALNQLQARATKKADRGRTGKVA